MTAGIYAELVRDSQNIVLVATGEDWEIDRAAKALHRMTPTAEKTDPPSGMLSLPCTWAVVTQLACTFNSDAVGRWIPRPRLTEWITGEFIRRHASVLHGVAELAPPGLVPRSYQIEAASMIAMAGKFLLFDEVGTGKTVSTVLGLKARQLDVEIFPLLIVAPSWSILDVWSRHIGVWAPEWPEPVLYSGPGRTVGAKILLTTYATLRLDAADVKGPLVKMRPAAVVCDEATALKGNSTRQSLAARRVAAHADTFVALTGTPVTRDTADIFPLLAAMDPKSWPARERFVKRYCLTTESEYGEKVDGLNPLAEPEFRTALAGQYRRVAKQDVLSQLPPKIYSVRRTEIPPAWRKAYDSMADEMLAQLPDDGELPVMSTLAQLTRLTQLASSACDVTVTEETDPETGEVKKHYEVVLKEPCWKSDVLLDVLAERRGQPVAVFAPSRQLILLAGQACERAGYRCGYVTGQHSETERTAAIDGFQAGELDLILCTTGAGGQGITLTAAGTCIFLQRPWSLAESIQAEGRCHRLGSERHAVIEVIDIVAKDSIDSAVRAALKEKAGALAEMVQDPRIVRELLGGKK